MHVHVNFGTAHSVRVICVKWVSVLCVKWVCRIWVSSSIFVGHSCKAVPYDVVRALESRDIYTRTRESRKRDLCRLHALSPDAHLRELSLSRARSSHFRLSRAHMADGTCTCVHVYMYMHMHMHMHMCVDRVDVSACIYIRYA